MKWRFILVLSLFIYSFSYGQNGGTWTWIHGDTTVSPAGNFGTKGVSSPTNVPPGRYHPAYWQDLDGNFWIFGNSSGTNFADMWKYNPINNEWTWMSGSNTTGGGVYGTKGIPSINNYPPNRGYGASCWVDSLGMFWLYGGSGIAADLWRYNPSTNEWTWMDGDNPSAGIKKTRSLGVKNVPASTNFPGQLAECKSNWVYNNELILFGGGGFTGSSEVWTYSIASNVWTWIGGGATMSYGFKGIPSPTNNPPSGFSYTKWMKGDMCYIFEGAVGPNVWSFNLNSKLFTWEFGPGIVTHTGNNPTLNCTKGGFFPGNRYENHTIQNTKCDKSYWTYGGFTSSGSKCDLWLYDIDSNSFMRVSGDNSFNYIGNYGSKGVSSLSNHPPAKGGMGIWNDKDGNLYIFGGYSPKSGSISGFASLTNDLWKFEPDPVCLGSISLVSKSLDRPRKTSICTSNDSVVLTLDTILYNVTWSPTTKVTVNTDTSRLVFKPTVKTDYMVTAFGGKCVSIDTLRFTIRIGSHTFDTIVDTTCINVKYPYNKSGIYDYVIRNASGCDSNIHLNLTIRDYIDTSYVDICKGGSFIFYGKTYSTAGTYSKIFKNQFNCDSTKVLVLKVVSPDTIYVKQTICQGDTLLYRGNKYATSGEYNFSRGCGMDVLSLWVRPKDSFVIFDTFCSGDTFKYQIHRYTASGIYSHKYASTDGCDSFMVFNLHVKTKTSDTIRIDSIILDNLCSINNKRIYIFPLNIDFKNKYSRDFGYNYQPASIFYNLTAGTYPIRIKRGCAFLDTPVTLPYRERDTSVINDETCVIFPYYFNNQHITKSGTYWDTFTNVYNCDSFIKLNLVVHKTDSFTIRDTICRGDTVMFDGFARTAAGTYYQYIKLFEGCDSTVKFILTVKRRDTMIHNRTICRGDTLYFSGNKYTEAGSYKLSYINKEGCDSFVHLNLTVKRRDTFLFHDTICSGAIKLFEGIAHTSNGNYVYKLLNSEGCDSFRILNLVVHRQDTNNLKYSKCIDDSIVHGGVTYKTTGVHNKLYKNIFKCDSLVILDLKFSAFESQTLNKNICPGDMFEGYKSAGTYYDTFKRTGKCDSIRELILTHVPIPFTKLTASICQTQTYTYRSKTFKTKGVFFDTIVTSKNCDSIIEIDLKVKDSSSFSYSHFICKSETYLFNNQNLNQPGFYKDTLINYLGCDSFVYLTLGYRPPIQDSVKVEICFGENFRGYTTTGIYMDTIQTALGCDSILKIDLKVLVGPYPYEQKLEDCKSVLFNNKLYTNSILIHDTLYNKLNCDSVYRKTDILIRPKPIKRPLENLTFCDSIRMSDGKVYRFNFSYQDTIRTMDTLACDSLYFPKLLEKKSKVNMTISIVPMFDEYFKGEKVELTTYPAKKLFWTTGDTIARINLVINEDQSIEVIGWDSEECKDTASINLRVIEPGLLDIPKAFAPGGMIENRLFKPNFKGMVEINRFEIYNRWGEKIYSTNTKEDIGWDGTYKGEDVPSGLFTFLLEYKVNRSIFFKTGEVLLVR